MNIRGVPISEIIEKHRKWINNENGGSHADLRNADLSGADLSYVNLRNADLRNADLSYVNLRGANLRGANLSYVNLRGANLSYVNLRGANLSDADLSDADLSDADLSYVNLSDADLSYVNLRGANLSDADLSDADLSDADLSDADLSDADLSDANLSSCSGDRKVIKSLFISEIYPITYTKDVLQIGCENHPIEEWWSFDDARIKQMDGERAAKFWAENKEFIKMSVEKYPCKGSES